MALSKNEKVAQFLSNLKIVDPDQFEILTEIRDIIFNNHPHAGEKIMYGGIVFFDNEELFSGLFVYKNHVSLEFSRGYLMNDPDKRLEGKGKYRRHLKIKVPEDIAAKALPFYIRQAIV